MGDRCTGHCCRAFTLPRSPEELAEGYRAWLHQVPGANLVHDIHLIYPMVRHLRLYHAGEVAPDGKVVDQDRHYYRCVHVAENGDCGIYADRPDMCRSYPDGNPCTYAACTWDAARMECRESGSATPGPRDPT